ncbi:hypothetical protein [Burkholderia stabilis]|uniref:hypothetical protein n=1 Tax=Burkholderia stabilis TaxID=95485 RepID=UPI001590483A|nr:hypothetical protein [Burkholderia stabilis]
MKKFVLMLALASAVTGTTAADVGGVIDGGAYDAALSQAQQASVTLQKRLVKDEVQRREHAPVESVDVVSPGVARAAFSGGVADVRFGFDDPIMTCPRMQERACEKKARDNPMGFKVLAYTSHRI